MDMNCDKYIEDINLLIDGNLNKKKTVELKEHMKTCKNCRKEYEELKSLKDMLGELEMKKLPENFEKELKIKLLEAKEEKESNKKSLVKNLFDKFSNSKPRYKLVVSLGMVAVIAVIGISGLGIGGMGSMNSYKSFNDSAPEVAMDMESEDAINYETAETEEAMSMVKGVELPKLDGGFGNDNVEVESGSDVTSEENKFVGRLIIKNADVNVEVQNFDGFMETINEIVTDSKGYISSSSSYIYRRDSNDPEKNLKGGNISIRVPSEVFDGIIYSVGEIGNVTNTNLYTEDISKRYRNTADEVKNLEIREARIREIMGKAEKIEDILKIEEELSRVRTEINRLKGNLSNWEDLVSLSTINIDVREVEDIKNKIVPVNTNVFQKAKEGFIETINIMIKNIEMFFVYVVTNLPVIVPVLIIGIIIIRKLRKMNIF